MGPPESTGRCCCTYLGTGRGPRDAPAAEREIFAEAVFRACFDDRNTRDRAALITDSDCQLRTAEPAKIARRSNHPPVVPLLDAPQEHWPLLVPHREIAQRVGIMAGPVVQRPHPELLALLVIFAPVHAQRLEPGLAFLLVEPAGRQQPAHRLDAVLDGHVRAKRAADPVSGEHLDPALAG